MSKLQIVSTRCSHPGHWMRNEQLLTEASSLLLCERAPPPLWFPPGLLIRGSHRAEKINVEAKISKLREFIDPVKAQWQEEGLQSSLKSYTSFCELLALDRAQTYLAKHRAHEIQDWGSCRLDDEGLAIQTELDERIKVGLIRTSQPCQLTHLRRCPSDPRNPS